ASARDELCDRRLANLALISLGEVAGRPGTGDDAIAALDDEQQNPRKLLLETLASPNSSARECAAIALAVMERSLVDHGRRASPDSLAALRAELSAAKLPRHLGALAIAVGIARDAEASATLRAKLVWTPDDGARACVALAFGMIGDANSAELISDTARRAKW